MDKLDLCMIPFIYQFKTTLILLSESTFIFRTPSIIGRGLKYSLTWMTIAGMHLILFVLSGLHILV